MTHRSRQLALALGMAVAASGCHHNKVSNPIANVDSKQPDKVLFDRAMDAMKHGKYDVARITLQTLINTYPDSEFIARAKLAVGDSWYAEGNTAAYQQAEVEYKDFITFFPNLPEAAEAQLKIANMHYKQMEKPDRDYTHALRAEDEYRQLLQQFPDSKLVPQAKQRLREVQEVLAERQYRIGRFYYLRESYPAAIARLKTMVDTYPLYSQADDALMMLAHSYEAEANLIKNSKLAEAPKIRLVNEYRRDAGQAYERLIERYPLSSRTDDARARLKDLGMPIPTPTKEAIAENRAEEESRGEVTRWHSLVSTFHKSPEDLPRAAKVGEPPLVDPQQTSAPQLVRAATNTALGLGNGPDKNAVNIEKASPDALKSEPAPRSDTPATGDGAAAASPAPATTASEAPAPAAASGATTGGTGSDTGIGELTPGSAAPSNAAPAQSNGANADTPAAGGDAASAPAQAPAQVNEIQSGAQPAAAVDSKTATNAASIDDANSSSSKKKKKKGLKRIVPF